MIKTEKITNYMNRADGRGQFWGLVNQGNWQELNFVQTNAGQIRGGHFHKTTNEIIFLVRGRVEVELNNLKNPQDSRKFVLNPAEGLQITPYVLHTFHYLENSEHIAMLDTPFDPANPDLHTP